MIASFTKWDNSLSGTLGASPMGVPLSEVLLYVVTTKVGHNNWLYSCIHNVNQVITTRNLVIRLRMSVVR